jgi:predicted CopG family antitoxin
MVTTIQIDEKTLLLLKKLKEELNASSYDEAITNVVVKHMKPKKSMAGSLAKYFKNYSTKKMVKELKEERRKFDRF